MICSSLNRLFFTLSFPSAIRSIAPENPSLLRFNFVGQGHRILADISLLSELGE